MAKKKEDHSREIFEQLMGETIESLQSKKFKFFKILSNIFGWAILIIFALGLYRLIEWLITM